MAKPKQSLLPPRIGGEIPIFSDKFGQRRLWRTNWLPFSNGRAAIAWLTEQQGIRSVAICAYTCPSVSSFLKRHAIRTVTFDIGATMKEIVSSVESLPGPRLIIVPVLFGSDPWLNLFALRSRIADHDMILLDAAQTAFGHIRFSASPRIAVLSCPRKSTELPDGAVLAVSNALAKAADICDLPLASTASALKSAARALWATGNPSREKLALEFNQLSERSWPDNPHRMSETSQILLAQLDFRWHSSRRRKNYRLLASSLAKRIPTWKIKRGIPFCLPIFVNNQKKLLSHLHRHRIFASALWPDGQFNAKRESCAEWVARHLVSLPIDQRHGKEDMTRIKKNVLESALPAAVPAPLKHFING